MFGFVLEEPAYQNICFFATIKLENIVQLCTQREKGVWWVSSQSALRTWLKITDKESNVIELMAGEAKPQ